MKKCNFGVGCEETGVCFASSQGKPEMCGREGRYNVCGTCMTVIEGEEVAPDVEPDAYSAQRAAFLAITPFLMLADQFDLGELDASCECCTAPPGFRYLVEQL